MARRWRVTLVLCVLVLLPACATRYKVTTYPAGAKIRIENVVTKEKFDIGEGPATFEYDERYGEGFVMSVEKDTFVPRQVYVAKNPGSETSYQINLEPKKANAAGADAAKDDDKKKDDPKDENKADLDKRIAVLERTFEIYKDALFSQRYGTGPAGYDRDKVDTQVALVSKAQQLIEKKDLNSALTVVKKIIDRDEYFAQGHVLMGTIHYLKGEMPEAITSWERALEINPTERLTRSYLTAAYRKAGKQLPPNIDELEVIDRTPASSPLAPDPLKLRLRGR